MPKVKVGINGFGRIGRVLTRIAQAREDFEVVAVNTRNAEPEMLAYLFEYDSVHRKFKGDVNFDKENIIINDQKIRIYSQDKPDLIEWSNSEVDVVVDATGAFLDRASLSKHLTGSVKKVVLTAPAKNDNTLPVVVMGVNDSSINYKTETIFSNASCTTNCAAPLFKILHDNFKVWSGYLSTVHAYTDSQELQDNRNGDFDRSRAAALSSIPATTGAAKAVAQTIPELKGRINGVAIRVPVPCGSFVDIAVQLENSTNVDELNALFKKYSENEMKGVLGYETKFLVSSDYIGNPNSCTFDANYTDVINGNFVKVYGWYDNEWGFSCRVADLIGKIGQAL
jgi:glyceraldehyde 3-phosphate dehydrogenase